jgi:hypothetical protein
LFVGVDVVDAPVAAVAAQSSVRVTYASEARHTLRCIKDELYPAGINFR